MHYLEKLRKKQSLLRIFLSAIRLPHGQLWATIKGHPHKPDVNHCVLLVSTRRSPGAS